MHNGSFLSHTMSNYGRKKDCKNERRTSGISDTTCSVQPPTLVFRRSWSHYTSPDSLLLIFNQNSFMEDKKNKKNIDSMEDGQGPCVLVSVSYSRLAHSKVFAHKSICGSETTSSAFSGPSKMLSQSGPYWMGNLIILPVPLLMCVFGPLCKMRGRDH